MVLFEGQPHHTDMPTNTTILLSDLSAEGIVFLDRALYENDRACADWERDGVANLNGRFGFFKVINTNHNV